MLRIYSSGTGAFGARIWRSQAKKKRNKKKGGASAARPGEFSGLLKDILQPFETCCLSPSNPENVAGLLERDILQPVERCCLFRTKIMGFTTIYKANVQVYNVRIPVFVFRVLRMRTLGVPLVERGRRISGELRDSLWVQLKMREALPML